MQIIVAAKQLTLMYRRMAMQIAEIAQGQSLAIVGIQSRGVAVAQKIFDALTTIDNTQHLYGTLDISFYRDDYKDKIHLPEATQLDFSVDDKRIVLIDDVLYTGRTIRAALDAVMDYGRPKEILLSVLVDRRYNRELPISPSITGLSIDTFTTQKVKVDVEDQKVILY